MMVARLVRGAAVLGMLVAGLLLVRAGLQPGPPAETPTPPAAVRVSADEARRIAASDGDVPTLEIPEDADLGPYVRTGPVPEPPADRTGGAADQGWADRLQIPSLYVDAHLEGHGVTEQNTMSLPQDLARVGRLTTTQPLAAQEGNTLLAGHVTWNGTHAALYHLGEVRPGATVRTWDGQGRRTDWAVTSVEVYDKEALPAHLFSADGPRRLVIVTCGGQLVQLDDGSWTYEDNIVVSAVPLAAAA